MSLLATSSRAHEDNSSLWPGVEEYCQQADLTEAIPTTANWEAERQREWERQREQQVQDAYSRVHAHFRRARQEYAKFRRNRLPSPAPSDEGSVACDSDADEFGYVPLMFNIENDDPEVEQIFGLAYAHRVRNRINSGNGNNSGSGSGRRTERSLTSRRVKPRYATVPAAKAAEADLRPHSLDRGLASPPLSMRRHLHEQHIPNRIVKPTQRRSRRLQKPSNTERARLAADRDPMHPITRRISRELRQQRFYALDDCGKARLVI